jgi:protoporphyrinogen/coproporphyrinogen III oxidase
MPGDRVLVVGAGISGLTAAWALKRRGIPVTVLEAESRAGGQIRSIHRDGFVLETGPNGYLDREGHVTRLAEALGIEDRLRPLSEAGARRTLFIRSRLRQLPTSPRGLLRSDVVPWWAKLRLMLEPFSRRGAKGVDESLAQFGRRHVGQHVTDHLIDAVQTGIFAGDGKRLSVRSGFPRLWRMEQNRRSLMLAAAAMRKAGGGPAPRMGSFEGGLQTLTDALADALGSDLRTGVRVRALTRDGERWKASHDRGTEESDRILLTVPAWAAAQLLTPLDVVLGTTLAAIRYVPVTVVHFGWTPALVPQPQGFGVLVPPIERRRVLGVLFISSAYPFRARPESTLLTTLVGGAHSPDVAALDDGALVDLVRDEQRAMLGIERAPDLVEIVRWPRAIPQYEVGHQARLDSLTGMLRPFPGLVLGGNSLRGPGVADCVREGLALAEQLGGRPPVPVRDGG